MNIFFYKIIKNIIDITIYIIFIVIMILLYIVLNDTISPFGYVVKYFYDETNIHFIIWVHKTIFKSNR